MSADLVTRLAAAGTLGVACLALLLAYRLQSAALRVASTSKVWARNTVLFMGCAVIFVAAGVALEIDRNHARTERGPGGLIGRIASDAFRGGDASGLRGRWYFHWFQVIADGQVQPYEPYGKPYGCEQADLSFDDARVEIATKYANEELTYWLEGRLSSKKNDLTLSYWKPLNSDLSQSVGVVFMHLVEGHDQTHFIGRWQGRIRRDLSVQQGLVLFARECKFTGKLEEDQALAKGAKAELEGLR